VIYQVGVPHSGAGKVINEFSAPFLPSGRFGIGVGRFQKFLMESEKWMML
jgi:hypothetical protein